MSILRSQTMGLFELVMTRETAWAAMNVFGQSSVVHFVSQEQCQLAGPFTPQSNRLQILFERTKQLKVAASSVERQYPAFEQRAFQNLLSRREGGKRSWVNELQKLQREVGGCYQLYLGLSEREGQVKARMDEIKAKMLIFKGARSSLGQDFLNRQPSDSQKTKLECLASLVDMKEVKRFQRIVFRVSRGHALFQTVYCYEMEDAEGFEGKVICLAIFRTGQNSTMYVKIERLVDQFSQYRAQLPTSTEEYDKQLGVLQSQFASCKLLFDSCNEEKGKLLDDLTLTEGETLCKLQVWRASILKEKSIYDNLNKFQLSNDIIRGQVWIPAYKQNYIRKELQSMGEQTPILEAVPNPKITPPTHFRHNEFLVAAQLIVDTYGVPKYKEVNPAPFVSVTFPFLFGVMFGDISLGLLLFIFGLVLIFLPGALEQTPLKLLNDLRYIIALMGFFATYCGWIYNDFICLSVEIFKSCYDVPVFSPQQGATLLPREGCVYPVGLDPVWVRTTNQLNFVNSLKMKLSVILGVAQMLLGILLKGLNALSESKLDFYFQFIPQLVFMTALFGYMDFLIIYKWLHPWTPQTSGEAPSIITTMINIPLKLGKTTNNSGGQPLWGTDYLSSSQNLVQLVLLLIAVVCVPLMLLPKPLLLARQANCSVRHQDCAEAIEEQIRSNILISAHQEQLEEQGQTSQQPPSQQESQQSSHGNELFVHQVIETIEFVLGSVSNTASYLRLWALSLAHMQLSKVFFEKALMGAIGSGYAGIPMQFFGYLIFAYIMFGVLFCMDSMECFLHSLRLHWVEFQSKFYKGTGLRFSPFSFRAIVTAEQ